VVLPDLVIPHRHCTERVFVMGPLREIAPEVATGLADGGWVEECAPSR
jgi:7,8-dihydro-6-hydroxymethylpterin-pyrophosphokinase